MACMLDVTVPKPGNVHRGADFADMTFLDFVKSAVAIGPVMDAASDAPLGETIQALNLVIDATNGPQRGLGMIAGDVVVDLAQPALSFFGPSYSAHEEILCSISSLLMARP